MEELINIRVEGSLISVEKGKRVRDLLSHQNLPQAPLFAKVEGRVVDMETELKEDMEIQFVYQDSKEALEILRHSTSHLMAHAVLELFPGTKTGIGPAVEDGFYYDFLKETPFSSEDLEKIESKMRELQERSLPIERVIFSKEEALKLFERLGQELKVELIKEKGGSEVTCYRQGEFIDFCLGPHLPSTSFLKHFKLLSVSGAYWKGDEKGKRMQRIHGTAFFSADELQNYLHLLEEAKKRDHRKLGQELDLFSLNDDLGGGLILWHPKGASIRHEIEEYWREEHFRDGYEFLYTPHIAKLDIWRRSGHTEYYEAMYPAILSDEIEYELRPMNCPFAMMVYKAKKRSYRDLPLRFAELGTVYRYERSGVLHGLLRVRGFTVDDAHIFCRADQLQDEIQRVIALATRLLRTFGFLDYEVFLSTRPDKYCGSIEEWEEATLSLKKALEDEGLKFQVDKGEGVFYGPKIDIKVKDVLKRSWQCTTIQLDFNLAQRFDLSYVGEDGKLHRPYLIHRALLGSLERFFGILIEHYNGNFPLWLAPIQVSIIPIAERHNEYARELENRLKEKMIRTYLDLRRETVAYKIREAETQKIPLILVVGDKEVKNRTASLRLHTLGDRGEIEVDEFLEKVKELIKNKAAGLNF